MEGYAAGVDDARTPYRLRVHQQQALDALAKAGADGRSRAWVVLPPGAGKTLVGLEAALRRGARTVVLGPNTAIQSQWLEGWEELDPGDTAFRVSIPAVVREGDLAPYAELAWLTTPTPAENDWLTEQGLRFAELTTALTDPSTGFLQWLDQRFSGATKLNTDPALTGAA